MEPKKWGPHLWFFLHTISFNYPDNPSYIERKKYNDFYNSLKNVLPCAVCQNHFQEHLSKMPPNLNSKSDLIKWTIDLHNRVNVNTNKEEKSYKEVLELYNDYYKNINRNSDLYKYDYSKKYDSKYIKYIQIIILVSVLSITLYFLFKNKKNNKKVIRY